MIAQLESRQEKKQLTLLRKAYKLLASSFDEDENAWDEYNPDDPLWQIRNNTGLLSSLQASESLVDMGNLFDIQKVKQVPTIQDVVNKLQYSQDPLIVFKSTGQKLWMITTHKPKRDKSVGVIKITMGGSVPDLLIMPIEVFKEMYGEYT